jgi:(S)-ureidoglycine aminohydrolase
VPPPGITRSVVERDHALVAPDGHVRAPLPGWTATAGIVHVSPRMGAAFSQFAVEMERGAVSAPPAPGVQRFVHVTTGSLRLTGDAGRQDLGPRDYAYLPAGHAHRLQATRRTRATLIEKPFVPLAGEDPPWPVAGSERDAPSVAYLGDEGTLVQLLLPDAPAFDLAVNTMAFAPGSALPFVEVHVMEHGLLMLEGTLVYRLGDRWYPVEAGDVVYMAPYCPQWAACYGKTWAKYLIYKDWNRDPLVQP